MLPTTGACGSSGQTFPHLGECGSACPCWARGAVGGLTAGPGCRLPGSWVGYLDLVPCYPHLRVGTGTRPFPRLSRKLSARADTGGCPLQGSTILSEVWFWLEGGVNPPAFMMRHGIYAL